LATGSPFLAETAKADFLAETAKADETALPSLQER
jgi:hypothetical protein